MIVLISLFCFSILIRQNDALQFSKHQRTQHCTRPARFLRTPLLSHLQMEKSGLILEVSDIITNGNSNVNIIKSIGIPRIMPPNPAQGNEWYMWLNVRDDVAPISTGNVLLLTSSDGLTDWKHHPDSPCLSPSKAEGNWWYFDAEHVGVGDVILPGSIVQSKFATDTGMYLMYIFGGDSKAATVDERAVKGLKMEIGVAVSQDGIHWSRIEGPSPYGAIVEVGKGADFDSQFVGWPCVLEVGSEYLLYYHTYDAADKKFKVGLATTRDGIQKWKKKGMVFQGSGVGSFDARGVSRRHVARLNSDGSFRMWYEAVSAEGVHSIGLAISNDGVFWTSVSDKEVFGRSSDPSAWDAGGVGSPHLVWMPEAKRWRLYYVGTAMNAETGENIPGRTGLGVAESTDEEGLFFKRITKL